MNYSPKNLIAALRMTDADFEESDILLDPVLWAGALASVLCADDDVEGLLKTYLSRANVGIDYVSGLGECAPDQIASAITYIHLGFKGKMSFDGMYCFKLKAGHEWRTRKDGTSYIIEA